MEQGNKMKQNEMLRSVAAAIEQKIESEINKCMDKQWSIVDECIYLLEEIFSEDGISVSIVNNFKCNGNTDNTGMFKSIVLQTQFAGYLCQNYIDLQYTRTESRKCIITEFSYRSPYISEDAFGRVQDDINTRFIDEKIANTIFRKYIPYEDKDRLFHDKIKASHMMEHVFPAQNRAITTTTGYGFYYPKTPSGFRNFMINHKDVFCDNELDTDRYEKCIELNMDPDKVFADFAFGPPFITGNGTGAAIAKIMSIETGTRFMYYILQDGLDGSDEKDDCIMVEVPGCENEGIPVVTARKLCEYAKELSIPKFGVCYHKGMVSVREELQYETDSCEEWNRR